MAKKPSEKIEELRQLLTEGVKDSFTLKNIRKVILSEIQGLESKIAIEHLGLNNVEALCLNRIYCTSQDVHFYKVFSREDDSFDLRPLAGKYIKDFPIVFSLVEMKEMLPEFLDLVKRTESFSLLIKAFGISNPFALRIAKNKIVVSDEERNELESRFIKIRDKDRGSIQKRIHDLEYQMEKLSAQLKRYEFSGSILDNISLLEKLVSLESKAPEIRKGGYYRNRFYSLWLGDHKVLFYKNPKEALFLQSNRKVDPLKIELINIDFNSSTYRGISLLEATPGDFFTGQGYILKRNQSNYASEVFEQVMTGEVILPVPNEGKGYIIKKQEKTKKEEKECLFRHWGQLYLRDLSPEEILEGQLLGSGGSYKAFVYGDRVVG